MVVTMQVSVDNSVEGMAKLRALKDVSDLSAKEESVVQMRRASTNSAVYFESGAGDALNKLRSYEHKSRQLKKSPAFDLRSRHKATRRKSSKVLPKRPNRSVRRASSALFLALETHV